MQVSSWYLFATQVCPEWGLNLHCLILAAGCSSLPSADTWCVRRLLGIPSALGHQQLPYPCSLPARCVLHTCFIVHILSLWFIFLFNPISICAQVTIQQLPLFYFPFSSASAAQTALPMPYWCEHISMVPGACPC